MKLMGIKGLVLTDELSVYVIIINVVLITLLLRETKKTNAIAY